jgi:hypothetical protein
MVRKRDVDRLVLKWRDRLWLNQWRISTGLCPVIEDGEEDAVYKTVASVDYEPSYRTAHVTIGGKSWDERSAKQRNRTICHEMIHVRLSSLDRFISTLIDELPPSKREPYRNWRHDLREETAETLTDIFLSAVGEL